jgi:hypothetical protein
MKNLFLFGITVVLLTSCSKPQTEVTVESIEVRKEEVKKLSVQAPKEIVRFFNPEKVKFFWLDDLEETSYHYSESGPQKDSFEITDGGTVVGTEDSDKVYFLLSNKEEHYFYRYDLVTDPRQSAGWHYRLNTQLALRHPTSLQEAIAFLASVSDTSAVCKNILTDIQKQTLIHTQKLPTKTEDIQIILIRYTDIVERGKVRSVEEVRNFLNPIIDSN